MAFIISLIQTLVNRGTKRWLDYWEEKLNDFSDLNIYDKSKCPNYIKNDFYRGEYSPAKLGIFFTDLVCLNCLLFANYNFIYICNDLLKCFFVILTFILNVFLIICHLSEIFCKKNNLCKKCPNCKKCKPITETKTCEKCICNNLESK